MYVLRFKHQCEYIDREDCNGLESGKFGPLTVQLELQVTPS